MSTITENYWKELINKFTRQRRLTNSYRDVFSLFKACIIINIYNICFKSYYIYNSVKSFLIAQQKTTCPNSWLFNKAWYWPRVTLPLFEFQRIWFATFKLHTNISQKAVHVTTNYSNIHFTQKLNHYFLNNIRITLQAIIISCKFSFVYII